MSDISKEELKKEIAAVLKDADLASVTSKKVRQEIEKKLDIDLSARRKEVDELVMDCIDKDKDKSKKNGNVEEDDEEEEDEEENEEEDEDEEEEEEEKKPKRSAPKKAAPPAKRSKTTSSDESEEASDDEGDDEYSPKKKSSKKPAKKGGRKKKGGSDDESDEDWGKKGKRKSRGGSGGGGAAAAKKPAGAKRGGGAGYTKSVTLSAELAAIVGEDTLPRHEVVKRIWGIIKERNLYDPKNRQFAICDDELLKVFGVKRFRTFGMMKFLKNHFKD